MQSENHQLDNWRAGHSEDGQRFTWYDWRAAFDEPAASSRMPYCLRIVLENCLRNKGEGWASDEDIANLVAWRQSAAPFAVPMRVSRVILPDSSGLPVLMDLAALRDALAKHGRDPALVQPLVPVDLVIDHSLIVDHHGSHRAMDLNVRREFERNDERYRFFKWAQKSMEKLRVVPPGMGIVHQVHLERLARVVQTEERDGELRVFPEFVLGGDSHTPMVNGLGVLAWGVGGVEIEAAVLGEPYVTAIPRVVGVRLEGDLAPGATVTDLVLTVTERLRRVGVTGAFVEFCGPSYGKLTVPDRATIANMAPEYGATAAFFPLDQRAIDYLRQTGREERHVALVEAFAKKAGLFRDEGEPDFDEVVVIDLSRIEPSLSGPKRPQDRLSLSAARATFRDALTKSAKDGGYGIPPEKQAKRFRIEVNGQEVEFGHGSLAIAAITACTSTSNPSVMIAAGLLARAAVERGLSVPPHVKTSLAPGSRVVSDYLSELGMLQFLEQLGFFVVGYGCTTCSGKSGPLDPAVSKIIEERDIVAAAVVSSNRNFEGRLHRQIRAGYLASPPLVVAFAIAGRVDIDLTTEPLGCDRSGQPVYLADIWPHQETIASLVVETGRPEAYQRIYSKVFDGTPQWQALTAPHAVRFPWSKDSTYILPPPFFNDERILAREAIRDEIHNARALGVYGDSLTTDHISPAGEIPEESVAGRYLSRSGVTPSAFNAYTMRRGNHNVMTMGTYANVRIQNRLVPAMPGGFTLKLPQGEIRTIYQAAQEYRSENTPLIVIGGRDYGMGSSRDWAAKGPELLGVRAVIAVSFERIHRSNLVALGIIPLTFGPGDDLASLGLTGRETFTLRNISAAVARGEPVSVEARRDDGTTVTFNVMAALSSPVERATLAGGGIFRRVFDRFNAGPIPGIAFAF